MDQADLQRVVQLEARMNRVEATMQALLVRLGINPAEVTPPEPQDIKAVRDAIRAALLAGDIRW